MYRCRQVELLLPGRISDRFESVGKELSGELLDADLTQNQAYFCQQLINQMPHLCTLQANSCEWEKCPHHRQGYFDMDQTYQKSPTASPIQKCTMKEQYKCCNYQGTLKEAAKYCQDLDCDISDCNDHSGGWNTDGYHAGGWPDFGGYDNYGGGYNGPPPYDAGYIGDKPQGNKGPNPNTSDYNNNDSDWRQGNTGPRPDADRDNDSNNGDRPQGNKGPRDGRDGGGGDDGGFLDQGLDSNCTREFTAGGACREVCKETVEYKLMGIVMSTHEETTTRECSQI